MTLRPVSESLGCSDRDALKMAQSRGLIDSDNMLHCWRCAKVCDWHVSLHCEPCQAQLRERRGSKP